MNFQKKRENQFDFPPDFYIVQPRYIFRQYGLLRTTFFWRIEWIKALFQYSHLSPSYYRGKYRPRKREVLPMRRSVSSATQWSTYGSTAQKELSGLSKTMAVPLWIRIFISSSVTARKSSLIIIDASWEKSSPFSALVTIGRLCPSPLSGKTRVGSTIKYSILPPGYWRKNQPISRNWMVSSSFAPFIRQKRKTNKGIPKTKISVFRSRIPEKKLPPAGVFLWFIHFSEIMREVFWKYRRCRALPNSHRLARNVHSWRFSGRWDSSNRASW